MIKGTAELEKRTVQLAYKLGLVYERYGKDGVTPVDVGEDSSEASHTESLEAEVGNWPNTLTIKSLFSCKKH